MGKEIAYEKFDSTRWEVIAEHQSGIQHYKTRERAENHYEVKSGRAEVVPCTGQYAVCFHGQGNRVTNDWRKHKRENTSRSSIVK